MCDQSRRCQRSAIAPPGDDRAEGQQDGQRGKREGRRALSRRLAMLMAIRLTPHIIRASASHGCVSVIQSE